MQLDVCSIITISFLAESQSNLEKSVLWLVCFFDSVVAKFCETFIFMYVSVDEIKTDVDIEE